MPGYDPLLASFKKVLMIAILVYLRPNHCWIQIVSRSSSLEGLSLSMFYVLVMKDLL